MRGPEAIHQVVLPDFGNIAFHWRKKNPLVAVKKKKKNSSDLASFKIRAICHRLRRRCRRRRRRPRPRCRCCRHRRRHRHRRHQRQLTNFFLRQVKIF